VGGLSTAYANGIKGEEIAEKLFDMGFNNIYLATGYDADYFSDIPFIRGIVGKSPPF
jgi:hypothetical protein